MKSFDRVVVVGCNGSFGEALGRRLAPHAGHLIGVDVAAGAASPGLWQAYLAEKLGEGTAGESARAIAAADLTLLCVPESVVLAALPQVLSAARPDACVADIASVKSRIAAAVGDSASRTGYLSLHPMFAPAAGFEHRNIVVVPLRENFATERLEAMLTAWRLRPSRMSAAAHDRAAAYAQAVPHSVLLALGLALTESGPDLETLDGIATPVHDAMLSLLARIVATSNDTYWSIQADNPYAAEARRALAAAYEHIGEIADTGDSAAYASLLARLSAYLGDDLDALRRHADEIIAAGGGHSR